MESEVKLFKRQAIKAAKDLLYGNEVVKQLEAAKTIAEMDRIMKTARKEKLKLNQSEILLESQPY